MRVLIADSDNQLLETLQSFLWDRGHEAEIVGDAVECMTVLRPFAPDCLVLADNLPGGGAEGVMRQTWTDSMHCQTPVILLTSEQSPREFESLAPPQTVWRLCQQQRLRKPFGLGELLDQLDSIASALRTTKDRAALAVTAG
jgi:DNA-binding response OmpR family regulator